LCDAAAVLKHPECNASEAVPSGNLTHSLQTRLANSGDWAFIWLGKISTECFYDNELCEIFAPRRNVLQSDDTAWRCRGVE
jgi:hypothetical protein